MRVRIFKIVALLVSLSALTAPDNQIYEKEGYYKVESIVIKGSTNISEFSLIYSQELTEKFMIKGISDYESPDTSLFVISVPVVKIKSDKASARKGFLNLIKAETYEFIKIALFQKDLYRILSRKNTYIIPLKLTIAGESFEYISPVDIEVNDGTTSVSGDVSLLLTDFKLDPPVRFLGLIRVDNKVSIYYRIDFEE